MAFKRQVVEQSNFPGTSVAQLAQEHGINANQIFAWRRAYRDGRLDEPTAVKLVEIEMASVEASALPSPCVEHKAGVLTVTIGATVMTVTGDVDPSLLRTALNALMAR